MSCADCTELTIQRDRAEVEVIELREALDDIALWVDLALDDSEVDTSDEVAIRMIDSILRDFLKRS